MDPLSVCMIGCRDDVQRNVLSMLINQSATLEAQFPDVDAAISYLRKAPESPRLFILYVPNSESLSKLRQLTAMQPGMPVMALVDAMMDPSVLLGAMRCGANQVVPLPIQSDDFRAALDCILQQYGGATSHHQLVTVSGATGGCGATMIALNVAHEIAVQHNQSVVLSELSLQVGKLAAYLDINPAHTTYDLLTEGSRIDPQMVQRALHDITDKFRVLVGEYRQITPNTATTDDVIRLIDHCRSLTAYAIFDVPCTYDDLYFETLAISDQVVLVGEQKIPSIRTLKLICDALERIDGVRKLHVVINRYDPKMPGFGVDRLKQLLNQSEIMTIANDYAGVMASINHGRPLRQESPRSPALADLTKLVKTLLALDEKVTKSGKSPAFFGGLIRKLGLIS